MKIVTLTTLEELSALAQDTLTSLSKKNGATVLALHGDLGVGKTAFTKEVARLLGISGEITSPTFVIMKSYSIPAHFIFKTLVHIDAYRIEEDDEMRVLGFESLLAHAENLIVIEWSERIKTLIPEDAYQLHFTLTGNTRTITTYGI